MKLSPANERNSALRKHQNEMKNLAESHQNELGKIKNNQEKQKMEMRHSHKVEIGNIRNAHDSKLQKTLLQNETTLEKAKENLEKSKAVIANEQRKIEADRLKEKNAQKELHAQKVRNASMKNTLAIEDMNQEATVEMQKLQRDVNARKNELITNLSKEELATKDLHKSKMNMTRDVFQMKQTREMDKFQNALLKQKKTNKDMIIGNERKHHKTMQARTEQYSQEIQKIDEDSSKKKAAKKEKFEKDFQVLNNKNEIMLRNLAGKKEKLIHQLKSDITKEYKIGLEKAKDPFYKFGRIPAQLTELPDQSGYQVKVPIAEHEASSIDMRAEQRQLRLTMERRYEFEKKDDNSMDKVSKVESFVSKMPVENIVDPKSISKEYIDGHIVFTIKNA
jgi:HSP20 family molecular chaperone IbpA